MISLRGLGRRHFAALLLGILPALAWIAPAFADQPEGSATVPLGVQIDSFIAQPRFAAANWGIAVVSLDSGRMLYVHHADQLFQPASTTKLFTTALALSSLGPDYRIPTQVLAKDDIQAGKLEGPLLLYGMGDPTLGADASTADWADQLAAQLAARGLRKVTGDLIADDTYFQTPSMGSGWEAIDLQSWFGMPTSALSVDDNLVGITISPGRGADRPAQVAFDPTDAAPALANDMTTGAAHTRNDINLYRAPGGNILHVFGTIAAGSPMLNYKLAMVDPARVAGQRLLDALARHGVHVDGVLRTVHWPQSDAAYRNDTVVLAQVLSPTVADILHQGLKRSQNLYMQNLLLVAGAKAQADAMQQPSPPTGFITTEAWGIRALRNLLDRIGVPARASLIEEGSGLSRRDLATPETMTRVLSFLAAQPYAKVVYDAVPLAGVDGTLQWRMRKTPAENNVRAKTGSMSLVHCLAGYVTAASGERLAFAIMLNNYEPPEGAPSASRDVDAIAVMLAQLSKNPASL
jgi:D-alanyl-D-alanine carboxypeptidase/D-alanyl-D-alanine-endopeptidase (penicillin-binding protein 4)